MAETAQCRLEVALGINQKVRADHNRFPGGEPPQHFSIAIGVHAEFYRARLKLALAEIDQHQPPYAGVEHRRIGHGKYLVFAVG